MFVYTQTVQMRSCMYVNVCVYSYIVDGGECFSSCVSLLLGAVVLIVAIKFKVLTKFSTM